MSFLTKDQILKAQGRSYAEVQVPGGKVRLVSPSADDAMVLNALYARSQNGENVERDQAAALLSISCVNEEGQRILPTPEDALEVLKVWSVGTVAKVIEAATKLASDSRKSAPGKSRASQSAS